MKKVVVIVVATVSMFVGMAIAQVSQTSTNTTTYITGNLTYTVDRIEEGQNGEQWVVVEVYDSLADEIRMIDILMEEGYKVQ